LQHIKLKKYTSFCVLATLNQEGKNLQDKIQETDNPTLKAEKAHECYDTALQKFKFHHTKPDFFCNVQCCLLGSIIISVRTNEALCGQQRCSLNGSLAKDSRLKK